MTSANDQRLETASGLSRRLLALLVGLLAALALIVSGAAPASAQNVVGPQPVNSILTVGPHDAAAQTIVGVRGPPQLRQASATGVAADTAAGEAGVAFGPAPENAWSTFDRVSSKGSPLPGYKGGSTFANDGSQGSQVLPRGNGVTYREWDVNPNVKGVDRGGERIVTGSDGTGYYTNDHYKTFTQFTGPGG